MNNYKNQGIFALCIVEYKKWYDWDVWKQCTYPCSSMVYIYLYTTSAKFIPIAFNFPLKDSKNKLDIMILIIVWALIFNKDRQYTALK